MFSSLELHGGPMFVHEFERLRPVPAGDGALGVSRGQSHVAGRTRDPRPVRFAGRGGARSVVAATFAVPDSAATVAMMRAIHEQLAAGVDVAEALRHAERSIRCSEERSSATERAWEG